MAGMEALAVIIAHGHEQPYHVVNLSCRYLRETIARCQDIAHAPIALFGIELRNSAITARIQIVFVQRSVIVTVFVGLQQKIKTLGQTPHLKDMAYLDQLTAMVEGCGNSNISMIHVADSGDWFKISVKTAMMTIAAHLTTQFADPMTLNSGAASEDHDGAVSRHDATILRRNPWTTHLT